MTVAAIMVFSFFLIPAVKCFESCETDTRLCTKGITVGLNSDLSLSCMPNGQKNHGQWMYCGPKGSGIHFTMNWLKDGIPIERQSARYTLENDNQTLTLLNTSFSNTGLYECHLKVFALKNTFKNEYCTHFRYQNYFFARPFVFTEFPNVTVTTDLYSGRTQQLNATFLVNITDKGLATPAWEMSSIYFSDVQVTPWVNIRIRPDQGFVNYEAMDLTHLHAYQDQLTASNVEPPEVSLNSYQEVVVVANISDSVSFDCPIRTCVPLTQQIFWVLEYLPYIWTEDRENRLFNGSVEVFNLSDSESLENCPFCHVTQRRWTLFVNNLTEEWDHSNLTCYVQNPNGTARIIYKIELLGVIPFEKEMSPQLQYPHWCLQRHFELGNQCQYKESKTVILIQPHTSPVVELSIDLWIGNYDRAKLTLNVVPLHCRSMDRSKPYHNCSEVMYWTEAENFGFQQVVFSRDVYLGYPYTKAKISPQYEGYLWFWDTYNYALGKLKKPDPVYFWVEEIKSSMPFITTNVKTPQGQTNKGEKMDRKWPLKAGLDNGTKETQGSESKQGFFWTFWGVSVFVLVAIVLVVIIVISRKKWYKCKGKRTSSRIRKIVRISEMQMNTLYLPLGSDHSDAHTEPTPLPEITIETCSGHGSTTNLVTMCDYEIPQDPKWEFARSKLVMGCVLGEGAFGLVKKATAKDVNGCVTPVAVKMLKDSSTDTELKSLLTELQVMKHISEQGHPNVIQLLGCCTSSGPVYVILEYAAHGNLKDYLRDSVSKLQKTKILLSLGHLYPEDTVTVKALLYFALQVSSGMEYIASLRIVHRDLAARNVLVADNHMLKITDFGFTRLLQDTEYYRTQNNDMFNARGLELIRSQWSYGVLLWELFSLGGNPYPFVPFEVMIEHLQKGLRMSRPLNCPDLLYHLMLMCWAHSAKRRPSFSQLHDFLSQVHANQTEDGLPVMPESDHEEMKWYYSGSFARASASSSLPYLGSSAERDSGLVMSHDDLHSQHTHKRHKSYSSDRGSSIGDSPIHLTPPQSQVFNILKSGEAVCDHRLASYPIFNTMVFTQSVENLENSVFEEGSESPFNSSHRGVDIHPGRVNMYQHSEEIDSQESFRLSTSPEDIRDHSPLTDKSSLSSVNTSQHKVRFHSVSFSPKRDEMHTAKCFSSPKKSTILKSSLSPKIKNMSLTDGELASRKDTHKVTPCQSPGREKTSSPRFKVLPFVTKSSDSLPKVGKSSPKKVLCSKIMATWKQQSMQRRCSRSSPSIATPCEPWSVEDLSASYSVEAVNHPLVSKVTRKSRVSTDSETPLLCMSDMADSDKALY